MHGDAVGGEHDAAAVPVGDDGLAELVVEDDPGTRELVRQALESNGFAVDVAPDGRRALEMVAADPPAAMVLDVMLPGLDGFSVVERMKAELPGGAAARSR